MPTTSTHAPGTFCWPELAVKDIRAGAAFYQSVFGWTVHETPMGEGASYYIFIHGQHAAAAGFQLDDAIMPGVPPHWAAYVSVADADATAARTTELGGKVIMAPFDVANAGRNLGRMAVLQDPTGAVFSVWQAREHCGVEVFGESGSLGWTQLNTGDTAAAKAFYTRLFGWTAQDDPNPMGGVYTTFMKADGPAGGMMAMPPDSPAPPHWLTYFAVDSVDATLARASAQGAMVFVPATDIAGMGRFAVLADPQGAAFALVTFSAQG